MKKIGPILRRRMQRKALFGKIIPDSDRVPLEIVPLVGRPTKKTPEVIAKLKEILKIGGTILEACAYAMIDQSQYHRWCDEDPDFASEMESARRFLDVASKNLIGYSVVKNGSVNSAMWWLDRHEFKLANNGRNDTDEKSAAVFNMPAEERKSFNEEFKKFLKEYYAPVP